MSGEGRTGVPIFLRISFWIEAVGKLTREPLFRRPRCLPERLCVSSVWCFAFISGASEATRDNLEGALYLCLPRFKSHRVFSVYVTVSGFFRPLLFLSRLKIKRSDVNFGYHTLGDSRRVYKIELNGTMHAAKVRTRLCLLNVRFPGASM